MIPTHLQGPSFEVSAVMRALGKTREEVIELLGEPYDKGTGSRKYPVPPIYVYGKYEIHFGPRKDDVCNFIMDGITHEIIAKLV